LTACASGPRPAAQRYYEGRFAVTVTVTAAPGERTENSSGRFTLELRADGLTLDLATPLGNTLARIETTAGGARMTAAGPAGDMRQIDGANADELAERILGWPLPVDSLDDWLAGHPDPARPSADLPGEPDGFAQDGWTVRVLERFAPSAAPRRLVVARAPSAAAPAVTLRLALDEPR
jgi:outer membrane lipoprotein LolB